MARLTDTQRIILSAASQREDRDEGMAAPEENNGRLAVSELARPAPGTIASHKRMSVSARKSARKEHRPGKAKTPSFCVSERADKPCDCRRLRLYRVPASLDVSERQQDKSGTFSIAT